MVRPQPDVMHAPQTHNVSLSDMLRAQTREAHERAEHTPLSRAILDHSITRPRYASQLHAWFAILTQLERVVALDPTLADVCIGWTPRSAWIAQDLEYLDPHGTHVNTAAMQVAARMIAWLEDAPLTGKLGALYVLEGSAMGGLVLRRHLAQALDLQDGDGLRYHTGHGPMSAPLWSALKQRMDAIPLTEQERLDTLAAAHTTFAFITELMELL